MSRLRPHRLAHRYRAGARSLTGRNRIWHDLRLERLDQLLLLDDAGLEILQLGLSTEHLLDLVDQDVVAKNHRDGAPAGADRRHTLI